MQLNKIAIIAVLLIGLAMIYLFNINKPEIAENFAINEQDNYSQWIEQAKQYFNKFSLNDTKIALDLFQQANQINPEGKMARVGISACYSQLVSKFNASPHYLQSALTIATTLTEENPKHVDSWWALGFALDASGRLRAAIEAYEYALKLNPNSARNQSSLAYLYTQVGQLEDALRLNILAYSGKQQYRFLQIAEILYLLNYYETAEKWFRKADLLNPDSVFAAIGRSKFLFAQNQYNNAKEILERAINNNIIRPELYLLLGQIAIIDNNFQQAEEYFIKAKTIDKKTPQADIWLFWLAARQTQTIPESLLYLLKQSNKQDDHWPIDYINRSILYLSIGNTDEAINSIETAIKEGYLDKSFLLSSPPFLALQQNPKFIKLVKQVDNKVKLLQTNITQSDWLPRDFLVTH